MNPDHYEQHLNPDKTLPEVKLYQGKKSLMSSKVQTTHHYEVLNKNNLSIGGFLLSVPNAPHPESAAFIRQMSIRVGPHEFAQQGFGKATYLAILKRLSDTKLHSGEINEGSKKIWQWLVQKGVAKQIDPTDANGEYENI